MVHHVQVIPNHLPGNLYRPIRRLSSMRRVAILVVILVVAGACAGGGDPASGSSTSLRDAQPPSSAASPSTTPETTPGEAPTTVPESAAAQELAAARERWAAADIGDHTLVVQDDCGECGPDLSSVSEVVVWAGETYASGAALTVENVFATVERALASGQDVEATYDAETGMPTEVWIDREARAYDGGTHLLIHDLVEGIPGDAASLEELRASRAVWDGARPTAYSFTVTVACGGCQLEGRLFTWVDRDEVVDFRVERIGEAEITAITIDQVFDDLDSMFSTVGGFDDGEIRVNGTARYDSELGYPTWIGLDIDVLEPSEDNAIFPDRLVYMISQFREQEAEVRGSAEFEAARTRWDTAGIADYSYVVQSTATSVDEPFLVIVEDEYWLTLQYDGSETNLNNAPSYAINDLFDLILEAEQVDDLVDVRYDKTWGYPTYVSFTQPQLAGATEWIITELTPAGG